MRRGATALAALALAAPAPAGAHPAGNASVNHWARLELSRAGIRVEYLLDYAELPSFRELERADPDRDDLVTPEERTAYLQAKTAEVLERLRVTVNGKPRPLAAAWSRVAFPPGEGGLSTVRIAWELAAPWDGPLAERNLLVWNDSNHEELAGWKEVRVDALDDLGVGESSLPEPLATEPGEYPEEILTPPSVTKAWVRFGPGMEPVVRRGEPAREGLSAGSLVALGAGLAALVALAVAVRRRRRRG